MASNTTYNPGNINDFIKNTLHYSAIGISGSAAAGINTNIDFKLNDDMLLTGAQVLTETSTFGDSLSFQIVDVDGIVSPAGTVLNQFVDNWQLMSDRQEQINLQVNYPAKIIAGLYLRLIYNSIGTNSINVAINYCLHKVLI